MARALAVDVDAARAILKPAVLLLGRLQIGTSLGHGAACLILLALAKPEGLARVAQLFLEPGAVGRCLMAVCGDPRSIGLPLGRLHFCALAAHDRVALPLFGDGHLTANLLDL